MQYAPNATAESLRRAREQELTEDALGFEDVALWSVTAAFGAVSGHLYSSDPQEPVLGLLWQARCIAMF